MKDGDVKIALLGILNDPNRTLAHLLGAVVMAMKIDGDPVEKEVADAVNREVQRVGSEIANRKRR